MAFRNRKLLTALAAASLTACAARDTAPTEPSGSAAGFCEAGGYVFHTDFETAALHACAESGGPVLTIAPEYAPINPSPWYAWRIAKGPGAGSAPAELTVRQAYRFARHRYHPWVSVDGIAWQPLADDRVQVDESGAAAFRLTVPEQGLYVAAQPPLGSEAMARWARELAGDHGLQAAQIARSVGERPVMAYRTETRNRAGTLVLTGRQHPPEVTGGLAFRYFAQRLFAGDDLSERFRARFAIGLVPEVNPDGVVRGHWRTNLRGTDLNRDWGPFTQPETRGVAGWMDRLHGEAPLRLFMDFHSTWQDVFYMPHPDDDPAPAGFPAEWRRRLAARLGDHMPDWSGQHNRGLPTAKSWVRNRYGIVGMTYEVGDDTPPQRIRANAEVAAEETMKLLLELEDADL